MKAALTAGAVSGIAGLLVFLVIHHIWIMPIWFILPLGTLIAGLGGLAVGWSYFELDPHLPKQPWKTISWVGMIGLILLPAITLAETREPMFDISGPSSVLMMSIRQAATLFIFELLVTATLVGALVGWIVGRTPRASLSTALAGLIFALGPGHNIPFLGSTPGTLKGVVILAGIVVISSIVLVEVQTRFSSLTHTQDPSIEKEKTEWTHKKLRKVPH